MNRFRFGNKLHFFVILSLFMLNFSAYAADFDEIIIIDFMDTDHTLKRELSITIIGNAKEKLPSYRFNTRIIKQSKINYSKGKQLVPPPIRFGDISIYPSAACRLTGEDSLSRNNKKIKIIAFDERVEIAVHGQDLNKLVSDHDLSPNHNYDFIVKVSKKTFHRSYIGIVANYLAEDNLSSSTLKNTCLSGISNADEGKSYRLIGAIVDEVFLNSPADKAGIKKNDIIVRLDGEPIRHSRKIEMLLDFIQPGIDIDCQILRYERGIPKIICLKLSTIRRSK